MLELLEVEVVDGCPARPRAVAVPASQHGGRISIPSATARTRRRTRTTSWKSRTTTTYVMMQPVCSASTSVMATSPSISMATTVMVELRSPLTLMVPQPPLVRKFLLFGITSMRLRRIKFELLPSVNIVERDTLLDRLLALAI